MPAREKRGDRLAIAGIFVLVAIWSVGWTTMKVATHYSGPMTFSLHRYLLGVVVLFLLLVVRRQNLAPTPWLPTILIGLSQTAAFQAFEQWALMAGGAGKTSLLAYTMPFFVVPLSWWWVREKPDAGHWLAIAVAAIGFLFIVEPWRLAGNLQSEFLAIAGGFFWAVGTVLSRRLFLKYPEVEPLRLTAWQMLAGTLALLIVVRLSGEGAPHWAFPYLGAVLYNGFLSSAFCWVLWAFLVQRLSANIAGLTSLGVPVSVVLLAWAFFGEQPGPSEWGGMVLVAAALLLLGLLPGRRAQ